MEYPLLIELTDTLFGDVNTGYVWELDVIEGRLVPFGKYDYLRNNENISDIKGIKYYSECVDDSVLYITQLDQQCKEEADIFRNVDLEKVEFISVS